MVQRVEQHTHQTQIIPQVQSSVQNQERTVIQPMIQRIEQHTTQTELQPSLQTQTQNVERLQIQPMIQRIEQHTTETQLESELKRETQNIQKKLIQPIIKDVIQPVHILVKPVLKEQIKPTIFQGQEMHQAINQGTQNLPISYLKTEYEQEVRGETSVKESIYRTNTLPVRYKPVQYKPEIGGQSGLAIGSAAYEVNTAPRLSGGLINGSTTIKPSIVRKSVLPTINQGVTVLNTVYGPTSKTIAPPGVSYNLGLTQGALTTNSTIQTGVGLGSTVIHPTINLGTTVGALGTTSSTQYATGIGLAPITTSQYGVGLGATTGVPASQYGVGFGATSGVATSQYGVAGTQYVGGKIMGVDTRVEDYAADVTYSTKPDSNSAYQPALM